MPGSAFCGIDEQWREETAIADLLFVPAGDAAGLIPLFHDLDMLLPAHFPLQFTRNRNISSCIQTELRPTHCRHETRTHEACIER